MCTSRDYLIQIIPCQLGSYCNVASERSLSFLRPIYSYTKKQARVNHTMMLHIHNNNSVANEFVQERKHQLHKCTSNIAIAKSYSVISLDIIQVL